MKAEDLLLPDPMEVPVESIAPVITRLASLQTALAARLLAQPANAPGCAVEVQVLSLVSRKDQAGRSRSLSRLVLRPLFS